MRTGTIPIACAMTCFAYIVRRFFHTFPYGQIALPPHRTVKSPIRLLR